MRKLESVFKQQGLGSDIAYLYPLPPTIDHFKMKPVNEVL
jgi:hypothetical protein